jgi:hypothetical protein
VSHSISGAGPASRLLLCLRVQPKIMCKLNPPIRLASATLVQGPSAKGAFSATFSRISSLKNFKHMVFAECSMSACPVRPRTPLGSTSVL